MNLRAPWFFIGALLLGAIFLTFAPVAQAHLRYVVNATEVSRVGTGLPYSLEQADRLGIGMLAGLIVVSSIQIMGPWLSRTSFFVALRRRLEWLGHYSPNLARILVALLLMASWQTGTLLTPQFGAQIQSPALSLVIWAQLIAGILLFIGLGTKLASILFAFVYLTTFAVLGIHGLDHFAMLGLAIFLFIEGGGTLSLGRLMERILPKHRMMMSVFFESFRKYSLLVLRFTLGFSLVWLGLTEKVLAPALTSYAIVKYGVPYFPDLTVFTFVFGVFEIVLGFHFVLGLFNRVVSAIYLGLLFSAVPIFGEWINHFYLFAAASLLLTQGAGPFRVDVRFVSASEQH